jgi:hypothetical protein
MLLEELLQHHVGFSQDISCEEYQQPILGQNPAKLKKLLH